MSWNLSRVINNLEHDIQTWSMHNPATADLNMASHNITHVTLVNSEDYETATYFSVNYEWDKLDNFDPSQVCITVYMEI